MAEPTKTDLESQVRLWIKKKAKETCRIEFKLRVEITTPGGKADLSVRSGVQAGKCYMAFFHPYLYVSLCPHRLSNPYLS